MMMMKMTNFSALQRTATRYALLSLLLLASLVLEVTSVKTKNGMANTTPYDDKKVVHKRILTEESSKLIFSRSYISVTQADDFTTLFPNGGDTATFLDDFIVRNKSNPQFPIQGSSTTQKGMYNRIVYRYISVMLCNSNRLCVCVCLCVVFIIYSILPFLF